MREDDVFNFRNIEFQSLVSFGGTESSFKVRVISLALSTLSLSFRETFLWRCPIGIITGSKTTEMESVDLALNKYGKECS